MEQAFSRRALFVTYTIILLPIHLYRSGWSGWADPLMMVFFLFFMWWVLGPLRSESGSTPTYAELEEETRKSLFFRLGKQLKRVLSPRATASQ